LPFLTNVLQCQIQSKRGNILFAEVEYNNNNNNNNNNNSRRLTFTTAILHLLDPSYWTTE
jgi:hypothetical protein